MLTTCSACGGFVPAEHAACPNCDTVLSDSALERAAKTAAKIAATGATMMVLMACYGGGFDEMIEENVDPADSCMLADELDASGYTQGSTEVSISSQAHAGSCGGAGRERIYDYTPDPSERGLEGTVIVVWTSSSPMNVYLRDNCMTGPELACAPAVQNGRLELPTASLAPFVMFVDADIQSAQINYEVQVIFEPGLTIALCRVGSTF